MRQFEKAYDIYIERITYHVSRLNKRQVVASGSGRRGKDVI
jgi:hypothetical protein